MGFENTAVCVATMSWYRGVSILGLKNTTGPSSMEAGMGKNCEGRRVFSTGWDRLEVAVASRGNTDDGEDKGKAGEF
jgi:hypothetical protein